MRVRGDNAPSSAFTLEEQPNHPGFVLARFYENAVRFEETRDGHTTSGYEYDEYRLELEDRPGLEEDIINGYDGYLAQAKLDEAEKKIIPELQRQVEDLEGENATLHTKVDSLESQVTDTQMALCDVFELATGGVG